MLHVNTHVEFVGGDPRWNPTVLPPGTRRKVFRGIYTLRELRFSNGRTLYCTSKHRIWATDKSEFVEARHLTRGTLVGTDIGGAIMLRLNTFGGVVFQVKNYEGTPSGIYFANGILCHSTKVQ